MLRKTAHFILYLSTLQKPAAGAGFCNVLKYKTDTFYLSTIQKPAHAYQTCFYGKLINSARQIKLLKLKKYSVVLAVPSQSNGLCLCLEGSLYIAENSD